MTLPRRTLLRWTGLLLLLGLAGCEPAPAPTAAAPPSTVSVPPLLFAVHPYDTPSRLVARFQPLCDYLGAQLKRPVGLYIAHSYGDQIRRITQGTVDLAYLGPAPYLRAIEQLPTGARLELIAAETLHGVAGYHSVILVREESPIQSLEQVRGGSFAFADHRSFGGHFWPRAALWQAGLTLADLRDYTYLGRHERVALAVAHSDFDAGGLREEVARHYLGRGLRIIATSPLLPPHVIAARPDLDPVLAEAVRQALIDPGETFAPALAALGEGAGFGPAELALFEPARRKVRAIEGARPEGMGP